MRWWNREIIRQSLPLPFMTVGQLVPGSVLMGTLAGWSVYCACYLLLTWLTFRNREPATLLRLAHQTRRQTRGDRWFSGTADSLSQGAAVVAMVATVLALPRAKELGLPVWLVLTICVAAIVSSWMTMHVGFLTRYLLVYSDGRGLDFPGDDEPGLVDFVYFTVAVGTTFGTTDVSVTRSTMRRLVLSHGVLSFLFNTLILAVAVTFLTTFIAVR